jgi:hypothetical protein
MPEEQPLNAGEAAPGKAKSDDDEDVQMSEEQQVEGDQASQEQRRPPRISAADRDIIAQGLWHWCIRVWPLARRQATFVKRVVASLVNRPSTLEIGEASGRSWE